MPISSAISFTLGSTSSLLGGIVHLNFPSLYSYVKPNLSSSFSISLSETFIPKISFISSLLNSTILGVLSTLSCITIPLNTSPEAYFSSNEQALFMASSVYS